MNLMISNYCNLHCSYCFAQEEMHSKAAQNVTMENLEKYLDLLKRSNFREARLIGGEPTLHPDLEKIIDKIISYDFFNDILIFTNLTFPREVAEMIVRKSNEISINLLPNINYLEYITPSLGERIIDNLGYLSENLPTFNRISINLFSPDQDLEWWEEICCKYNIQSVRWSIVVPNQNIDKDFNVKEYFHKFQPLLIKLVGFMKKYNISAENDCSVVPLCALDAEAIKYITQVDPLFFRRVTCEQPAIDIAPDLLVRGCFCAIGAENTVKKYLTDFETVSDIVEYYEDQRKDVISNMVARKECIHCPRYETYGQCCTCLGYRVYRVEECE